MLKSIKVKILERKKIEKFYLIKRFYKETMVNEYIICINYDKKTNTYDDGLRVSNIQLAYSLFNDLVKNKELPVPIENNNYE